MSRRVNRIVEKGTFERPWHSFVDVQAVSKMREGITYISKSLTKTGTESRIQVVTRARYQYEGAQFMEQFIHNIL